MIQDEKENLDIMKTCHETINLDCHFFYLESVVAVTLPSFGSEVPNVTVTAGKDALLPCVVDNLGHFKVSLLGLKINRLTCLFLS